MPYPPPATCQFFRSAAVAFKSRGYQARGTVIVRPSPSPTLKVSLVTLTWVTRSSALSAKMPMPRLQQCSLMLSHDSLKPPQFLGREPEVVREADGLQPELGG